MIRSDYLDLAVGMAVVFFLAGMLVSGFNEGISWLTRVRSKFLWAYLYDLFSKRSQLASDRALPRGRLGIIRLWGGKKDVRPQSGGSQVNVTEQSVPADDWLRRVAYALDPIDAPQLTTVYSDTKKELTSIKNIPPPSLAQALLEVFADVGRQEVTRAVAAILDHTSEPGEANDAIDRLTRRFEVTAVDVRAALMEFRTTLADKIGNASDSSLTPRREAAVAALMAALFPGAVPDPQLVEVWRVAAVAWPTGPTDEEIDAVVGATARVFPASFARLRIEAAIGKLDPNSPIAPTVKRLWEAASGQIDQFREHVEKYLDGELKRLGGYYKRSIRIVMFSLAFLVALLGGIDAISVGRNLWRNPEDRATLAQLADDVTANGSTDTPNTGTTDSGLERIRAECEKAHPPDDATINNAQDAAAAYAKVRNCVSASLDQLTGKAVIDRALWTDPGAWWDDWTNSRAWLHAIGVILTALALMLGAPFWFDIIKRVTGLRRGLVGET